MSMMSLLLFVGGLLLLVGGAEVFIRGSVRLAAAFGVSPLVIGLTIVGFGTSAPELAVSIQSGFAGQTDIRPISLPLVVRANLWKTSIFRGLHAKRSNAPTLRHPGSAPPAAASRALPCALETESLPSATDNLSTTRPPSSARPFQDHLLGPLSRFLKTHAVGQ